MQSLPQHPDGIRCGQLTLTGMLAQQRQDDVARAAEHRRVVAVARTSGPDHAGAGTRTARPLHTPRERVASLRPTLARAVVTRAARARTTRVAQHHVAACCV